jgi:hypothetical protein
MDVLDARGHSAQPTPTTTRHGGTVDSQAGRGLGQFWRTSSASTTKRSPETMINSHTSPKPTNSQQPSGEWLDNTLCSGLVDLTENAAKQNLQENSTLQDKGLLSAIFANEAKRKQKPIYQKTEML